MIRVRDRQLLLRDKCGSSSWCLLRSAVNSVNFSCKIMQERYLIMSYPVVVVVLANYIEHSLENLWSSSVMRCSVCMCVCVSSR